MSDIQFSCPECGHSLAVDSAGAGMLVPCPECQKEITIPAAPPPPPPSRIDIPPRVEGKPSKKNRLPVIGLVLGILGLWFMGLLAAIPAVICAHIAKARARKDPAGTSKGIASAGLIVGYIAVATIFMGPCGLLGSKWGANESGVATSAPIITAEAYKQKLQSEFNSTDKGIFIPQAVFEWVHPVGTASRIVVHDVALSWKNGQASSRAEDLLSWTARLTVYWSAILVTDGYTKLQVTYDNEVGRITGVNILATNGQTHDQVNEAAWNFGTLIGGMLAE